MEGAPGDRASYSSAMIGRVSVIVKPCQSLADVAAIEAATPSGASRFHHRRYERTDGSVYLLAWLGDLAAGHVLVTPESKYEEVRGALGHFPEVSALGVAEAYRRRGVGRALMTAAGDVANEMGGRRLGLAVEADNRPAVRLYQSLGFERRSTIEPVDVWTWTDDNGVAHEQRDPCTYWTREPASP